MSDPVLALVLTASFFLVLAAAHWFKTLDGSLWREASVPLIAGVISGIVIRLAERVPNAYVVMTGVMLTIAALYVRLTGRESEPSDGMALGAMTGAAAAVPLVVTSDDPLIHFASCVLAGAVAGYGITFGLTHVRQKLRQAAVDAVTAGAAIVAAALPPIARERLEDRSVALAAAGTVPLLLIITVFKQWPVLRDELRHEAALGVLDEEDVHPTAHPLRSLGRAGWHDAAAHREFVRIARTIALRKRQQRGRTEEVARLYQLEVIKLRMELQEMTRIDRAMRAQSERATT